MASKDLGRNRENNSLAVFDSYILASPEYLKADVLFQYFVLESHARNKACSDSAIIQNSMYSLGFRETPEETARCYQKEAKRWAGFGEKHGFPKGYLNMVGQYIGQGRAAEFVKELACYMLNPGTYGNDDRFIKEMVERL
ncbi:hypothetical protein D7V86_07280 [bacterium D16-51]|nr:hypothetical protein D7V96_10345 [bacterium D16-59]RKI60880.1 hypothetical protein D7V86_07280 [bacterium D16-51]